jgi:hypothetical protein
VIERLGKWAAERPGRPALLIRRALKRAETSDERTAAELYEQLNHASSLPADRAGIAWRAIELMDLGPPPAWILDTLAGSLVHPMIVVVPLHHPSGAVIEDAATAEVASDALLLRALTKGHQDAPLLRIKLDDLARRGPGFTGAVARASALHGIAADAVHYPTAVDRLVTELASMQHRDGGWGNAELFHIAQALLAVEHPDATRALRRGAEALAKEQREDGGFGGEERSWIACRWALRVGG